MADSTSFRDLLVFEHFRGGLDEKFDYKNTR
jgi:hypothetical protein